MSSRRSKLLKPPYPFVRNDGSQQSRGLLGWWSGEPSGCGQLWNMSPAQHNGILANFATPFTAASGWTAGVDGGKGALIFDGVDDIVTLTSVQSARYYFTAIQPFTVSFWTKIIAQPSNTAGFMAGVRVNSVGNGWFIYWIKAASQFYLSYQGLNNNYHARLSTGGLALKTLYHVTCTRDSSNTMGGTQIYINGKLDVGTTDTPGTPNDFLPAVNPVLSWGNDQQNPTYPSNCVMEDLRIYNRNLAASEVLALYEPLTRWELRYQPGRKVHFGVAPAVPPIGRSYATSHAAQNASRF